MEPIKLTYDVPVSQAAAFYLFVSQIGQWWPSLQSVDPARYETTTFDVRVGGQIATVAGGHSITWGEVTAIDPPRSIHLTCWMRGEERAPSEITVMFDDSEWGARVTFVHGGWNEQNAFVRGRYTTWPLILSNYVSHARQHARRGGVTTKATRGVA